MDEHEAYPLLAVLVPTFNRSSIVQRCLRALDTHLFYRGGVRYYVSVDGFDDTVTCLSDLRFRHPLQVLTGPHKGLGGNLNHLIHSTTEPLLFQLDDDHILTRDLDLDKHVRELMTHPQAGWVRLMGVGGHKYRAELRESYWYIAWDSPELYIPSNRPHLKKRSFHDWFGTYPEGVLLWQTEEGFCHQCRDIAQKAPEQVPHVLIPLDSVSEHGWDHIGQSFQLQGY